MLLTFWTIFDIIILSNKKGALSAKGGNMYIGEVLSIESPLVELIDYVYMNPEFDPMITFSCISSGIHLYSNLPVAAVQDFLDHSFLETSIKEICSCDGYSVYYTESDFRYKYKLFIDLGINHFTM